MILTVTPNPCVDKSVFVDKLVPGTFMRSQRYTTIPGGKGTNVARAVKALGGETAAMVLVGGHTGRHVVDMIESQDGVRCIPVWVNAPTRTITTVLEESTGVQTAFFEPGPAVTEEEEAACIETFRAHLDGVSLVTLNGSVPDPSLVNLYRDLIVAAHEREIPVILDSYGEEFAAGLESYPDLIKPNIDELKKTFDFPLDTDDDIRNAIGLFHMKGVGRVVISMGKAGALVSDRARILKVTPPAIEEVNPVGSGDAMVAAMALAMVRGDGLEDLARAGAAAGAANASSWDIGHFSKEEADALAPQVTITPF